MRIRSFIIAYALVLAILLFADRRPGPAPANRYSHVIDLTGAPSADRTTDPLSSSVATRIIAPGALIPGTWSAGQIPAERLIAPLVVMDLTMRADQASQITLSDVADSDLRGLIRPHRQIHDYQGRNQALSRNLAGGPGSGNKRAGSDNSGC